MPVPYEGAFERLSNGVVYGWVSFLSDPASPCEVEIVGPGGFFARDVASRYRPDRDEPRRRNGLCGFEAALPPGASPDPIAYAVVVAGFPHRLQFGQGVAEPPISNWADDSGDPLARGLLVHRCHQALTGRAAPPDLLDHLVPSLPITPSGVFTLVETLRAIVATPLLPRTAESYVGIVQDAYRGILRRDAEPRGIELYCEALQNGLSVPDLMRELIRTPEFLVAAGLQRAGPPEDGGAEALFQMSRALEDRESAP